MLKAPGLELLTGEPGVGKTAALRNLTRALNPHRFLVLYQAKFDLATWRLRPRRHLLRPGVTPLWIIDEAQNLPREFFRDFPAFLNFALRPQRDLITVWPVGHPALARSLERAPYAALCGWPCPRG